MMDEKEPEQARQEYEEHLKQFFRLPLGELPRFDVIFLGLGEDGHIASLFPGSAALTENEHWVATIYVEKLKAQRLTLTLPVINAAAQIIFLVAGQSKSAIVKFEADADGCELPAAKSGRRMELSLG